MMNESLENYLALSILIFAIIAIIVVCYQLCKEIKTDGWKIVLYGLSQVVLIIISICLMVLLLPIAIVSFPISLLLYPIMDRMIVDSKRLWEEYENSSNKS